RFRATARPSRRHHERLAPIDVRPSASCRARNRIVTNASIMLKTWLAPTTRSARVADWEASSRPCVMRVEMADWSWALRHDHSNSGLMAVRLYSSSAAAGVGLVLSAKSHAWPL